MSVDEWRLPERMEVVAATGTLRARLAAPEAVTAGTPDFLRDDGHMLPLDTAEVDLGGGVMLARSATGGLSLRTGRLREVLAAAETDALVKRRAAKATAGDTDFEV